MNLNDGANFLTFLIKRAKTGFNKQIKCSCDTKRRIWEIEIRNGLNTHTFQRLHYIGVGDFLFKVNLLGGPPKPVELTHKSIKTNLKYQDTDFYSQLADES